MNERQMQAVTHVSSPLLVLAGAGSGKTRVITHKISHLIDKGYFSPKNIFAMTFTNKAAKEMNSRVGQLLSKSNASDVHISTFHTLGLTIIKNELSTLGYKSGFSIFDAEDSLSLIKEVMKKEFGTTGNMEDQVQHQISAWKNGAVMPEQAYEHAMSNPDLLSAAKVYEAYSRSLKAYNAFDFDDLILTPTLLLKNNPDILDKWRNKIQYMLVDEYQDTNASQYQLIRQIVGNRGGLTVVGDDDQSIYAWRGAQPENMLLLQNDFPNLKVVKLEQNYRSTSRILRAANTLIKNNPHVFEKELWSEHGDGDHIRVIQASSDEEEAERVISELIAHRINTGTNYSDYAILYRGNHQSRLFERHLREERIPYFLSGGMSFFSFSEVKDVMSYLKLMVNPNDDTSFLRIVNTPKREIGTSTLEKLSSYATERNVSMFHACSEMGLESRLPQKAVQNLREFADWLEKMSQKSQDSDPIECINALLRDIQYMEWLKDRCNDDKQAEKKQKNVIELVTWIGRIYKKSSEKKTLPDILAQMALMDAIERGEEEKKTDCVYLMTLHASKGLEFPHVFLVGMEEEILPHKSCIEEGNVEEERRLAYVGVTRAKKTLTCTMATKRKKYGEISDTQPSRFLMELPQDDIRWEGGSFEGKSKDPLEKKRSARAHLDGLKNLLSAG